MSLAMKICKCAFHLLCKCVGVYVTCSVNVCVYVTCFVNV